PRPPVAHTNRHLSILQGPGCPLLHSSGPFPTEFALRALAHCHPDFCTLSRGHPRPISPTVAAPIIHAHAEVPWTSCPPAFLRLPAAPHPRPCHSIHPSPASGG